MRFVTTTLACALLGLAVLACGTSSGSGGPSATGAAQQPVTVWAVGDADTSSRARSLAAFVRHRPMNRFIYLGDVYETGTAREFRTGYDALWGPLAARTTPTPGNHEWPNRDVGYRPYWQGKTGRPVPDWRRVTLGAGWELLSLNSEAPHGTGSEQARWLARATRRPGTCRIAAWHRPRYSTGWHGDQSDVAPLWDGLRGHARIILSGHDHDLQRFADRDGLRQVVAGAGGRVNVPVPHRSAAEVRYVNRWTTGAARLRLTRGRATIELVSATGRVLDRSAVRCRPI